MRITSPRIIISTDKRKAISVDTNDFSTDIIKPTALVLFTFVSNQKYHIKNSILNKYIIIREYIIISEYINRQQHRYLSRQKVRVRRPAAPWNHGTSGCILQSCSSTSLGKIYFLQDLRLWKYKLAHQLANFGCCSFSFTFLHFMWGREKITMSTFGRVI